MGALGAVVRRRQPHALLNDVRYDSRIQTFSQACSIETKGRINQAAGIGRDTVREPYPLPNAGSGYDS